MYWLICSQWWDQRWTDSRINLKSLPTNYVPHKPNTEFLSFSCYCTWPKWFGDKDARQREQGAQDEGRDATDFWRLIPTFSDPNSGNRWVFLCIWRAYLFNCFSLKFFFRDNILVTVFHPSSPPGSSPPIQLHSFFLPTHPAPCFLSLHISRRGKNQLLCPEIQGTSLFHLLKDQRRHAVSRGLRRILTEEVMVVRRQGDTWCSRPQKGRWLCLCHSL